MQNISNKFSRNKIENEKNEIYMEIENAQIKKANLLLDMYKEYDGLEVKEAEGLWDEADWNKKTVWINETFSGKLKNSSKSEKTENAESFKIFFIIKNGNVYIKKAGVSVSEEGEYISDLDK